ncbi:hypothetical protein EG830_14295, partial [bacterium]|nr:hypothetical protein [bacterium]
MTNNNHGAFHLLFVTVILISANSCIKDPTLPVVDTDPATEISINSAHLSGTVTDDGGAEITARGFCWGNEADPTIDGELVPAGIGPGKFSAILENLEPNTRYNVRAFAENSVGIAYGINVEFVTNMAPPAVTTAAISSIAAVTAICGGNVTYDGGAPITAKGICWSTEPQPDITDPHTNEGPGSGTFTSSLANLTPASVYYVRAYVSNQSWTVYGDQITFRTKLTDAEGNLYNTVLIGTNLWMSENLRTTRLNDNSSIPEITGNTEWIGTSSPAYCWYDNNGSFKTTYGALYNWYSVNTGKLCPTGWHVPTDQEFSALEITLGMASDQSEIWGWRGTDHGLRLKNTNGWDNNGNGTNSSGFSALPGGYRYGADGQFFLQTSITYWWTSSEHDADRGWYRRLDSSS